MWCACDEMPGSVLLFQEAQESQYCTNTLLRTFAPEFSHFMEVPVPIDGCDEGVGSGAKRAQAWRELLGQKFVCVEVWHHVTKRCGAAETKAGIIGRRLGPSFQDVMLGVAHVPLEGLLRQTGVRGWYPLLPPPTPHSSAVSGPAHTQQWPDPPLITCDYVGGVEVSGVFSSQRDQQLILSSQEGQAMEDEEVEQWEVELEVMSLWAETKNVCGCLSGAKESNCSYCFVRYRFFDLGASHQHMPIGMS